MKKILSIILVTVMVFSLCTVASAQTMESTSWGLRFTISDNWTRDYSDSEDIRYKHNWGDQERFSVEYGNLGVYASIYDVQSILDETFNEILSNSNLASTIYSEDGSYAYATVSELPGYTERKYETYNGITYYRAKKGYRATGSRIRTTDFYITLFATIQYGRIYIFTYECRGLSAPHLDDVKAVLNNVRYMDGNGSFYRVGDVIGSALKTDIVASVNGHQIPSYNVDGYTYIVAEDLRYYGFSVIYDNASRSLSISRDYSQSWVSKNYTKPYVSPNQVGIKEHNLLYTDITTYLDGNYTPSYNINGQTIIRFDSLGAYGNVGYNNYSRQMTLTIPGIR